MSIHQQKKIAKLSVASSLSDTIKSVDVVAILTEWEEFKGYDWNQTNMYVFDGRRILSKNKIKVENLNALGASNDCV